MLLEEGDVEQRSWAASELGDFGSAVSRTRSSRQRS